MFVYLELNVVKTFGQKLYVKIRNWSKLHNNKNLNLKSLKKKLIKI